MHSVRRTASVIFILMSLSSGAYTEADRAPGNTDTNRVDRYHRYLSRRVLRFAESINNVIVNVIGLEEDHESGITRQFYGNLLTAYQVKGSHIRMTPRIIMADGADTEYKLDFSARLRLSGMSDRLRLYAESYDTDYDTMDEIFSARYRRVIKRERGDGATAGLTYFFTDRAQRKLSLSTGLRFRPEPSPKVRLRWSFRKSFDLWRAVFAESGFWNDKVGFGERTQITLYRPIGDIHIVRLRSSMVWSEVSHGVDWGHNVSCYARFSSRRSGAIKLGVRGTTHPSWVTDQYLLRVTYRKRIHRDWLFLEIEPGVDVFREDNFTPAPLINIKIELVVGTFKRL